MADSELKRKLFGRDASRTVVKLVIASLVVGGALAMLGVSPIGFWRSVFDGVRNLLSALGESVGEIVVNLATYLLFGALIVVPVWFVSRLLSGGARPRGEDRVSRLPPGPEGPRSP